MSRRDSFVTDAEFIRLHDRNCPAGLMNFAQAPSTMLIMPESIIQFLLKYFISV